MASKPTSTKNKKDLAGSPLQRLRSLTGWTREVCARHCGTSVASIQNYERGFAPLPLELALALETACGVSAAHLHRQHALWLNSGGKDSGEKPMSMGGFEYKGDSFEKYCNKVITEDDRGRTTLDIHTRSRLLLGALASKPHLFRIAYRKLVQTLDDLRRSTGISEAELVDFASQGAEVEELVWTIGELAADEEISQAPRWISGNFTEKFGILKEVKIRKETFPFWPDGMRFHLNTGETMAPDFELTKRTVWRITMPDGTLLVIPVDNFQASGLLTNTKPDGVLRPVQFSPALQEIHSQSALYLKGSGPEKPKKTETKRARRR